MNLKQRNQVLFQCDSISLLDLQLPEQQECITKMEELVQIQKY